MPRLSAVVGAALTAGLALSLVPGGSVASEPGVLVADDPVDWTPDVLDGRVRGIATVGATTVVVGDFSKVREKGSADPVSRSDIFAFDDQGRISTTFVPRIDGSEVFDVIPSGDGTSVYIAGSFRAVDGKPRTTRVTRLDVRTGEVVKPFSAPPFNNKATALDLVDGVLYVAGWFTRVDGQRRRLLTALDSQTGADLDTVDLRFRRTWNGGVLGVAEMAVRPNGSSLVVIGNFRRVEGQYRPQVAMIDLRGRQAKLDTWSTTGYGKKCSPNHKTYMWGLDASPNGRYFVIGTSGGYAGGPARGTLCDTLARWEFGRHRPDRKPTWIDYTGGDTVTDVEITDAAIYTGGHFRWMNNPYGRNVEAPGAVRRMGVAALDPRNGLPLRWNPGRARGWGVWGFASTDAGLWVGHDTTTIGGEAHERLALLPLGSGSSALPPDNTGALPGEVYLLGRAIRGDDGTETEYADTVAGRSFSGDSAGEAEQVDDGGVPWSQARGAFMVDGFLYTAWADGTLTRRGYNGVRFGTPSRVDLHGLTAFSDELASMRSLWFDRRKGRIYFTLEGRGNRLFYRYFTPESNTVGAILHRARTRKVRFDRVTGAFLADGRLWFRNESGVLRSVRWKQGPVPGTIEKLSGPGLDDASWSSRTFFLHAQ